MGTTDSAFNIHGNIICDVKMGDQTLTGELQDNIGSYDNLRSVNEAVSNSTDTIKENSALWKEFGNVMPEIIRNLRYMNAVVAQTGQSLPAIKNRITDTDRLKERLSANRERELATIVNTGGNLAQYGANGNVGGMASSIVSGSQSLLSTVKDSAKAENNTAMLGVLSKLGVAGLVAGAVVGIGNTLAEKYIDEMPTIYGSAKAFGSLNDDEGAKYVYSSINSYNKGTNLDTRGFNEIAVALRKQGIGNGLSQDEQLSLAGNIAQATGRWAYATGGDASQYANLAGLMSRYGGSKNVAEDFNHIVSAGYASGLEDTQIPEFLSGIQKVMEDGIAKGFSRSATEVADTLMMFSKLSGGDKFWQGEQGAKILNQASSGIASATNLSKTEDILTYMAFSNVYNSDDKLKAGLKKSGGTYIQGAEYSNLLQMIEGGITGDNWNAIYDIIDNSYGSDDEKIDALKNMTGLNTRGAARMWALGKTSDNEKLKSVQKAPENLNNETKYQDAMNTIKDFVVKIGSGAAELKISGMDGLSSCVESIAEFLGIDPASIAAKKENTRINNELADAYDSFTPEQEEYFITNGEFIKDLPLEKQAEKAKELRHWNGWGRAFEEDSIFRKSEGSITYLQNPIGVLNGDQGQDYDMGKYLKGEFSNKILTLSGGNLNKGEEFINFVLNSEEARNVRKQIARSTEDSKLDSGERSITEDYLKKLYEIFSKPLELVERKSN